MEYYFGHRSSYGKAEGGEVVPALPLHEKYLLRAVGIDPSDYYLNTLRNNYHVAASWENNQALEWERTRYLSFMVLDTTFAGMQGVKVNKKIKSPMDLFKLPNDPKMASKVLTGDAANEFMKQIVKK